MMWIGSWSVWSAFWKNDARVMRVSSEINMMSFLQGFIRPIPRKSNFYMLTCDW